MFGQPGFRKNKIPLEKSIPKTIQQVKRNENLEKQRNENLEKQRIANLERNKKPKVLVINYNENNEPPNKTKLKDILTHIQYNNPDIFILTTQNSSSGTDSHIQHSVKEKIENSKKRKYLRPNNKLEASLKKYKLFSKVDGTRLSNSKLGLFKLNKPYNVRTRIWINTETVYQGFAKNFSKNSYSNKVKQNATLNHNSNISNTTNINNSKSIKIKKYSYQRITAPGENGKAGVGSIMTSISLEKNGEIYGYIILNTNPILPTQQIDNNNKIIIKNLITTNNINSKEVFKTPNSTPSSLSNYSKRFLKGNIIILCISKSHINVFDEKKNTNLFDAIGNITKKSKKNIIKNFTNTNIKFIQIENDNVLNISNTNSNVSNSHSNISFIYGVKGNNSYTEVEQINLNEELKNNISKITQLSIIKNNFYNLEKNIIEILSNCKRPINEKNINKYITENSNLLIKNSPFDQISYDSILKDLKDIQKYVNNKNQKINESVSEYLSIWEKINETYFFSNEKEKQRNNEINVFLLSKNPDYTPPIYYKKVHNNNNINEYIS